MNQTLIEELLQALVAAVGKRVTEQLQADRTFATRDELDELARHTIESSDFDRAVQEIISREGCVTKGDVEHMISDNDEGFATESYVDDALENAISGSAFEEAVSEAVGNLDFQVTVR